MRNRPGLEDGGPKRCSNYSAMHASNPNLNAITNHADGTCSFIYKSLPEKGVRTIDVMQGGKSLFSISIGKHGACYQLLDRGRDEGCYMIWEDEV